MKLESLKDLYIHELKDLHSAEKQITKALPKMAEAASNDELATAFREHLDQTHEHIWRLKKILGRLGESFRGPKCKGMGGLLKEGAEMIETDAEDDVRDAVGEMAEVEFYAGLEAPFERHLVDGDRALAVIHRGSEMPGCVEMRRAMRRQPHPFEAPAFAVGQLFLFSDREKTS